MCFGLRVSSFLKCVFYFKPRMKIALSLSLNTTGTHTIAEKYDLLLTRHFLILLVFTVFRDIFRITKVGEIYESREICITFHILL